MGPNWLALSVRPCFVEASPTVEKAVSCYRADRLLASLLSFCSIQSSLSVCEFRVTGKERCEQGHKRACVWTFDAWCCGAKSASEQLVNCSYVSSVDLPSDSLRKNLAWWAVTQRTLKNHKTVKIGGWALVRVWALARDNTVVEKLNSPSMRIFLQKAYSYLVTLLAFLPQACNQGTPPGADV